jgi:hypothetical protein
MEISERQLKNRLKNQLVQYLQQNSEKYASKTISGAEILGLCEKIGCDVPRWMIYDTNETSTPGFFNIPDWCLDASLISTSNTKSTKKAKTAKKAEKLVPVSAPSVTEEVETVESDEGTVSMAFKFDDKALEDNVVPTINDQYVKFGYHDDVTRIVKSKSFYPIYIAGLSGNGKTFMVEQICAELKRPMVRVNITKETDEDDLLGGFRLINGETKFCEGPVIRAMRTGAILLLDEVHLAAMTIMCLQPVLEGRGVFLKKINKFVMPAPGFQVIATANTKGKFSENGTFAGANIQDEAFLDRFAITIEQDYPTQAEYDITDDDFVDKLTTFASHTRKMYAEGGLDEVISTRRLVNIAKCFAIFGDYNKAIEYCTNRFDESVKVSLRCFWDKLFEKAEIAPAVDSTQTAVADVQTSVSF